MNHMLKSALGAGLAAAVTAGLTACGGSSSSSGSSASTVSVTGVVTDPAISGAQVRIDNSAGNALASVVSTDSNGSFTVSLTDADDIAYLSATGGQDATTGYSFTGLTLRAMYETDGSQIISPLTTLVVEEMEDSGSSYETAISTIADRFGLSEAQVVSDPTSDAAVQKISLQLTMLATALRANGGFDYVEQLTEENGVNWSNIAAAVDLEDESISSTVQERISELVDELNNIDLISTTLTASDFVNEANRLAMIAGVMNFLEDSLEYDASVNATATANVQTLAEALWNANEQKGLSTDSAKFANMVRYIFNIAGITTTDLEGSDFSLNDDITSGIASIAELDVINHKIPLAEGEYLTTSDKKRAYFYASDLSPYYRAQRIFDGILDDTVTDNLYSSIVESMALNNQFDDINVVIRTQIANPLTQAEAAKDVAEVLLEKNLPDLAINYLDEAWSTFETAFESIGVANITKDQANFMQQLAGLYNDLGSTDKGTEVLEPLEDYISLVTGTYSNTYSQIVSAFNNQAEALTEVAVANSLDSASVSKALEAISLYARFVDGLGPNGTTTCYKAKGSAYVSLAEMYRQLDQTTKTREMVDKFVDLRTNDDCGTTLAKTDTYVDDLVDVYLYLDDLESYSTLVNTMESSTETAEKALTVINAVEAAKAGDTENAIKLIVDSYPEDSVSDKTSQLKWLTNLGINRGTPYLAVKLFNDGYTSEGSEILDKAWEIATSETYNSSTNLSSISAFWFGCPKVAQLTYDFVNESIGKERMQECITLSLTYQNSGTDKAAYFADTYLIEGLLETDQGTLAAESFNQAMSNISDLSGSDYIDAAYKVLGNSLEHGIIEAGISIDIVSSVQTKQKDELNDLIAQASDEDSYDDIVEFSEDISTSYNEIASGLQNRIIATGLSNSDLKDQILDLRAAVYDVISLAQPSADKMAKASNITAAYKAFAGALSNARYYDEALALRDLDLFSGSDANTLREIVSDALVAEDDFTGLDIAARDIDLDGMPDFFEASAAEDDILNSGAVMDNDSDSDGYNDSEDTTPFYCEACAG